MVHRLSVVAVCCLAQACAFFSPATRVDVSYPLPDGRQLEAHYSSTKDIAAPSFVFERGPDGQIQRIVVSAEASDASTVIDANTRQIIGLGSAIGAGVATGLRAAAGVPPVGAAPAPAPAPDRMRFEPVDHEQVEDLIWRANTSGSL